MNVPETVILDLQASVNGHRKDVDRCLTRVRMAEQDLAAARKALAVEENTLREVVEFLAKHNNEACDWRETLYQWFPHMRQEGNVSRPGAE